MSNYNSLKTTIDANIKQNGRQEITGQILNSVLNQMVTDLGAGYQFAGVATTETNPGTPDAKVFYIANGKGTYTNFGGIEVTEDEVVVLYWDSSWHKEATGIASQEKFTELKEKVDALALGTFYGYFPNSASLPMDITTSGYAYVGLDNPYKIWNFNGESWSDSGTSIDMNDADEEDITRNADGKLQFKDRTYGDGMGYVILRKDKTFAEQVVKANTIYEIRYDFILGENITIPNNCVLKFNGGSISGEHTITGQNTCIDARTIKIFNTDITLVGAWNINEAYPEWFGAKGDGITECAVAINKTIQCFKGKIKFSNGRYIISQTIILANNTIIEGNGSGPAFRTTAYGEVTTIMPSVSFQGDRVISADPKDDDPNGYYKWGCCIKCIAIDCINIANESKTIIALMSVTNTDVFENIKVINNNTNIALWIDESDNINGMEPDGIIVSDFYCLSLDGEHADFATLPLAIIGVCNEVSIRDSKFQRSGNSDISDSVALLINAKANGRTGKASNGITIDSCSFTEAEAGIKLVGNATDINGPRYVRIVNCTWEYCKYPILTKSDSINKPVQFCNFGPGNRVNTIPSKGIHIKMESYSADNILYLTNDMKVECASENTSNIIIGGNENSIINGNTNLWIKNDAGSVKLNHTPSWNTLTLGSGWTNASPSNRNIAQYQLYNDRVNLRGYLTAGSFGYPNYIFNLPEGARPKKAYVINLNEGNKLTVLDDGNCFIDGSGTIISIDGISFNI